MHLIMELAEFENESKEVELNTSQLEKDGFGEDPKFHCFVAESDSGILGIALTYWRYSTWKGRTLHLEDLFVTQAARGKGLGYALLDAVIRYGHAHGCRRVQWEVLDWNEDAIRFYKAQGAAILKGWNVVHLRADAILEFVKREQFE